MKRTLLFLLVVIILFGGSLGYALFLNPRPVDTTEARVFEGDPMSVDYCDLAELDGSGLTADDIPKAYTPQCGWETFPMPVLANCTEPLAPDAVDMRGLWLAYTVLEGHVERIEQCGNRTVVTSAGIIHDYRTDGTLRNGSRDIERPSCINTYVSIDYDEDGVMNYHPFGLPYTIVTRRREGEELVWTYPRFRGDIRMKRICKVPESALHPAG